MRLRTRPSAQTTIQPTALTMHRAPRIRKNKVHDTSSISSTLALGAGRYCGTEKFVKEDFQRRFPRSIKRATVGFMTPNPQNPLKNPTPQEVSRGNSGYVEVVYIELIDPKKHFEELIRFFFMFHDPTEKKRQGKDCGFQFSSYIFCSDLLQAQIASSVRGELQELIENGSIKSGYRQDGYRHQTVQTKVSPMNKFCAAPINEQDVLTKRVSDGWFHCTNLYKLSKLNTSNHHLRMKKWPAKHEMGKSAFKRLGCWISPRDKTNYRAVAAAT